MAWSFTKTESIADLFAAIYGKGLKLYKNKLCRNLQLKTDSITHSITDISSKDLKLY